MPSPAYWSSSNPMNTWKLPADLAARIDDPRSSCWLARRCSRTNESVVSRPLPSAAERQYVRRRGAAMLTQSARRQFLRFCNSEIDAEMFEAWVCADDELESQIGHGAHLDLITADYRGREAAAARERCAALLEQHHPGNLARYRIRSILQGMLGDRAA